MAERILTTEKLDRQFAGESIGVSLFCKERGNDDTRQ